jgi:hypothetical protein
MLTALAVVTQQLREVPLDWWVLGTVFVSSFLIMWMAQVLSKRAHVEPASLSGEQQSLPSSDGSQFPTRWIEFYDSRSEKNNTRGDLEKELKGSARVWKNNSMATRIHAASYTVALRLCWGIVSGLCYRYSFPILFRFVLSTVQATGTVQSRQA